MLSDMLPGWTHMLSDTGDDEHKDKDDKRPTIRGEEARYEDGNED